MLSIFCLFGYFYVDELYLCLVLGKRVWVKFVYVDWFVVKVCLGVVDWLDYMFFNGRNMWGIMVVDEEIFVFKEVYFLKYNNILYNFMFYYVYV